MFLYRNLGRYIKKPHYNRGTLMLLSQALKNYEMPVLHLTLRLELGPHVYIHYHMIFNYMIDKCGRLRL